MTTLNPETIARILQENAIAVHDAILAKDWQTVADLVNDMETDVKRVNELIEDKIDWEKF